MQDHETRMLASIPAYREKWLEARLELEGERAERSKKRKPHIVIRATTRFPILKAFADYMDAHWPLTLSRVDLSFKGLPSGLHGFRILHLTDLHLNGNPNLADRITRRIRGIGTRWDLAALTGDYTVFNTDPFDKPAIVDQLKEIVQSVQCTHGVWVTLGNHDSGRLAAEFEKMDAHMLVNEVTDIEHRGSNLRVAGTDDTTNYERNAPNILGAEARVPEDRFGLILTHAPDPALISYASGIGYQLYLAGHTHAGQVCWPGKTPVYSNDRGPFMRGRWQYDAMTGYTSRGIGTTGWPLRTPNCSAEIALITLHAA